MYRTYQSWAPLGPRSVPRMVPLYRWESPMVPPNLWESPTALRYSWELPMALPTMWVVPMALPTMLVPPKVPARVLRKVLAMVPHSEKGTVPAMVPHSEKRLAPELASELGRGSVDRWAGALGLALDGPWEVSGTVRNSHRHLRG